MQDPTHRRRGRVREGPLSLALGDHPRVQRQQGTVIETHAGEKGSRTSNRVRRNCGWDLMIAY